MLLLFFSQTVKFKLTNYIKETLTNQAIIIQQYHIPENRQTLKPQAMVAVRMGKGHFQLFSFFLSSFL